MPNRLKISSLFLSIISIFILSGCVTIYNPATQQKEILFIDTKSEVGLGKDMDSNIETKLKILEDPRMQNRLVDIGARLAKRSDRQDLDYHFRIVKDKELNAFAIPGGFIYVNSGLMDIASDDELACVLAHEIGHVAARHSVKKLQAVLGYQLIAGIILGASGNQAMSQAIDVVFNVASMGYSRKDELLADRLAVKYAKKAGFNPYGMITFFEKLKQEAQKKGPDLNLAFLSSHPPIEERIKQAKNEIALNP